MKNKSKITAVSKVRPGLLTLWSQDPQVIKKKTFFFYFLVKVWLLALNEIPINYLLQNYIKQFWKQKRFSFFLKYRFLKKNILNNSKKLWLVNYWKKKNKKKNYRFAPQKFWRPRHLLASQVGKITSKWFKTGLHINVPIFFFPTCPRVNILKIGKFKGVKKKGCFLKKSKIQVLKLFLMKLLLEREFQKKYFFPLCLNFRNLMFMNKRELRLQTTQNIIFEDFFFFQKDKLFRRSISVFTFGFYYGQSKLIAQQIAIRITRTRKHWRTIKQLQQMLHYLRLILPETSGFQINIYGKIGAKTRTKFFQITSGKLPKVQTLGNRIHYTYQECYSFTGVFGIHVWLCTSI